MGLEVVSQSCSYLAAYLPCSALRRQQVVATSGGSCLPGEPEVRHDGVPPETLMGR